MNPITGGTNVNLRDIAARDLSRRREARPLYADTPYGRVRLDCFHNLFLVLADETPEGVGAVIPPRRVPRSVKLWAWRQSREGRLK